MKEFKILKPIALNGIIMYDGKVMLDESRAKRLCDKGYLCSIKEFKVKLKTKELKTNVGEEI
jgi:hypothetical protein